MIEVYQLKVTLKGVKPAVWRRLLLSADMLLEDVHKVLQSAMGWQNGHLHQFFRRSEYFEPPVPEDIFEDQEGNDYSDVRLHDLLSKPNDKMTYEYDFGDGWEHVVLLEKVLLADDGSIVVPSCTGGSGNCPPEDCGGAPGYMEVLKALKNPGHPMHETYKEWYPEGVDPEHFDLAGINEDFQLKGYGCPDWLDM